MSFLDFAVSYFTSQPTMATLALLYLTLASLLVLFRFEKRRPSRRMRVLFASFAVETSAWTFLGSSLLFCGVFIGLYQSGGEVAAVRMVFGLAVLVSLAIALPLSAFATFKVPRAMARRLMEELPESEVTLCKVAKEMAGNLGVAHLMLLQSPSSVPFAYSVGGPRGVVVVSSGLVAELDDEEFEAVLAHEIAHVKNHDAGLNTMLAVYRRVLFFDPLIRLLERAVYSEKEFSADELSARETLKPLSLASALLKISSAQSGGKAPIKITGLSILGSSRILRPPGVKERIERLVGLATELEPESVPRKAGVVTMMETEPTP